MRLWMKVRWVTLAWVLVLLVACGGRQTPAPVEGPGGLGGVGAPGGGAALGAPGSISGSRLGPGSQQDLAATAGDRVFFDYDRSELTPEARIILERQAQWLKRYPNVTVTIEGHTDERGTREYNISLGERRAETVKNVLIALGIPASRISTISYGKERPEVPHSDEESFAQNRRAVTVVN
jgi:peptidoglycan-associated lipoprotein